jgi:bacillithiol biosynthesis deacetylase BshB1
MKLDILAFGAHPDDVELGASGTLFLHLEKGYTCGIIDLTRGELGTRGSAQSRDAEALKASEIMGIQVRENLNMDDGFFLNDKNHQLAIVTAIRKYRPEIVLATAGHDRHPDHAKASVLISSAVFLAGLIKVETKFNNVPQEKWNVRSLFHYIQDRHIKPDFVVDITRVWDKKLEAVKAFSSQFYDPQSSEPETAISGIEFMEFIAARAMEMGRPIGARYAEGFTAHRTPGVIDLFNLV